MNINQKLQKIVDRLNELNRDTNVVLEYEEGFRWSCHASNESSVVHMMECGGGTYTAEDYESPEDAVDAMLTILETAKPFEPYVEPDELEDLPPGTFSPRHIARELSDIITNIPQTDKPKD